MKRYPLLINALSACNRSRQIWTHLNELRGIATGASWLDCDLKGLAHRLAQLRDDLAMHYAHEWGGNGGLREAALEKSVPRDELSLFLQEQTHIYGLISDLAAEAEDLLYSTDVSAKALSNLTSQFKAFDALLISHESRKSMALSALS